MFDCTIVANVYSSYDCTFTIVVVTVPNKMNGKGVLAVVRYLMIAVALLHASRGARPRLQVVYGLDDVDNENTLECIGGGDNNVQPGATYT